MLKNAIAYLVTPGFRIDGDLLRRRLARECGPTETRTDGFAPPCDHSTGELVHGVSGIQLICFQTDDNILPGAVIAEAVQERAEEIEQEQGHKLGRKQTKELKERVIEELLPQAFTIKKRTLALITGGYFIIDTSSQARADLILSALAKTLDTVPLSLIWTKTHVMVAMADWLEHGSNPDEISVDRDCVLEGRYENNPSVSYSRTDLDCNDVRERVASGYMPKRLALTFDDRISFLLTDELHLRRLQLLDFLITESREQVEDVAELFDADLTLVAGEITKLLDFLIAELGGIRQQEADLLSQNQERKAA